MPSRITPHIFALSDGERIAPLWRREGRPDVWSFFDRHAAACSLDVLSWILTATPSSEECVRLLRHLSLESGAGGPLHERCLLLAGRWLDDRSLSWDWTEVRSEVQKAASADCVHWADQAMVLGTLSAKFFKADEWAWLAGSAMHVCGRDRDRWRSLSRYFGSLPELRQATYYRNGRKHNSRKRKDDK